MSTEEHASVTLFREYLRIRTDQPNPDYYAAAAFFKRLADQHGFGYETKEMVAGKPIVLLKWEGKNPSLPAILLNSHVDVVPVSEEKWTHAPFGAEKDDKGNIYARGSQDMKCVSIQHIEAVAALKKHGLQPLRTIYLSLVPDEEIGSADGVARWVESDHFKQLNIGFALDEGLANPTDTCLIFYGERVPWWLMAETSGPTGHGSQLLDHTAATKLLKFLSHLTNLRDENLRKLQAGGVRLGNVTTVNINMVHLGMFNEEHTKWQTNIIPPQAQAAIDIRIDPTVDLPAFQRQLHGWAEEAGVKLSYLSPTSLSNPMTDISEKSHYWTTFAHVLTDLKIKFETAIFPAATDSRFFRYKGIPAIGFSPMANTPVLLHDHDEHLNENTFLAGIGVFEVLINKLANLEHL